MAYGFGIWFSIFGFRVQGSGFRAEGSAFRVEGLRIRCRILRVTDVIPSVARRQGGGRQETPETET